MHKRSWFYGLLAVSLLVMLLPIGCNKKAEEDKVTPPQQQAVKPSTSVPEPSARPSTTDPSSTPSTEVPASNQPVLSTARIGWGIARNKNHTSPGVPAAWTNLLSRYQGYYLGDTSKKVVYLT
ncbi:MAG: hypothetical protein ACM3NT_11900, partial [Methylocystaceae bacterium]